MTGILGVFLWFLVPLSGRIEGGAFAGIEMRSRMNSVAMGDLIGCQGSVSLLV